MLTHLKLTHISRIILLLLPLLLLSTYVKAAPPEQLIFIAVNDQLVEFADAKPFTVEGVTFVPLRSVATLLNAEVTYDNAEDAVVVRKDNQYMKINLNEKIYENEMAEKQPISLKTVNNRTLLPLRFIAEYFQLEISFYEKGPIARLIDNATIIQLTNEQLYAKNKEKIDKAVKQWKGEREKQTIKEQDRSKIAYLTFDDGPNEQTAAILDILQKYDAKATFFMIEPKIRKYKGEVLRMVSENHAIASHSVTHDKSKVYKNPDALLDEMNITRATLFAITGIDSHLIRTPYGSKPYLTENYRNLLAKENLQVWDWNVDSNDWRYSPEKIVSTVENQVKQLKQQQKAPVILFHNQKSTIETLPEIIEFLKAEGYILQAYDREHHMMVNFWNDERI
ncbi:MAG TPA: polysaccharide deacetylase family protein [Bacillus bacterium]|nr:polysaccharide deacetylase family protein [Bacillus sp. (in: firmicutes)]